MNVVYWCPARNIPTGGVRVIYRHCDVLNELGVSSQVFHPGHPNFSCTWFEHQTPIKRDREISIKNDFSIIPEGWSVEMGSILRGAGAKYGIFVQNSLYVLGGGRGSSAQSIRDAYANADCILTISDYTTEFVKFIFPFVDESKIIQLVPSVTGCRSGDKKEKMISIMPRKLERHALYIQEMAKYLLPRGWSLTVIDKMTEQQTLEVLSRSSIFISLSDTEGLGLPPIEAALSGNLVIGYTGEGGGEYFEAPLFKVIENGDFIGLFRALRESVEKVEKGYLGSKEVNCATVRLQDKYSAVSERGSLLRLLGELHGPMGN